MISPMIIENLIPSLGSCIYNIADGINRKLWQGYLFGVLVNFFIYTPAGS